MERLSRKVALVTGGTSGIGEATARLFAAEGAQVAITGRRRALGEQIVGAIRASGGKAVFVEADVRHAEDCRRSVDETLLVFGRLDVLFNNAGVVTRGSVEETDEADWDHTFDVNVKGTYLMTREAVPIFRRQGGGVVVNNASDWGVVGGPRHTAYSASKGAVVLMTKSIALDYARDNIRVNCVCAGDTFVERWRTGRELSPAAFDQRMSAMADALPMGRLGTVDEIAKAVLFLACDDSSFMTGASLIVDGGNTAG